MNGSASPPVMPAMNSSDTQHMHPTTPPMHHHPTTGHGDHGDSAGHVMQVFFNTEYRGLYLLFEPFLLQDVKALVVACLVLFLSAFFYEGLIVLRTALNDNSQRSSRSDLSVQATDFAISEKQQALSTSSQLRAHVLQSALYTLQLTLSYLLMLAVMTFNVWIGLSVVVGAGCGYLAFTWKKNTNVRPSNHCM